MNNLYVKQPHTPGPWFLFANDHCVGGPCDHPDGPTAGVAICNMQRRGVAENQANARLIASAPDHAMFASALIQKLARWEPFPGSESDGEVCVGGLRYCSKLDEFGVPVLTDATRAEISKTKGLK